MNDSAKGTLFALLSPAFLAGTFLFSKIALQEINTRSFILGWMLSGGVYAGLLCMSRRAVNIPVVLGARLAFAGVGLAEIVTSTTFFSAIQIASQPSLVAFLSQVSIVLAIPLGVVILGERIQRRAVPGIALLLGGCLCLSRVSAGLSFELAALITLSAASLACGVVLSKAVLRHTDPITLLVFRNLVTAIGGLLLLPGELCFGSSDTWLVLALGSFAGPFLGFLLRYLALQHTQAWTVATWGMTVPLFVSIFDWIFLGNPLSLSQIPPGLMVLSGSWVVGKSTIAGG